MMPDYYWIQYYNTNYWWGVSHYEPCDCELWRINKAVPEGVRIWPKEYDNVRITKRDEKILKICRIWMTTSGLEFANYFSKVLPVARCQKLKDHVDTWVNPSARF